MMLVKKLKNSHLPFPQIHAPLMSHLIFYFSVGPFSPANYSFSYGGGADAWLVQQSICAPKHKISLPLS